MWHDVDEKSISECKRLGHDEVTEAHAAYALAVELERAGSNRLPVSSSQIKRHLPSPGFSIATPKLPDNLRDRLNTIADYESAAALLATLVEGDWSREEANSAPPEAQASREPETSAPDSAATADPAPKEDLAALLAELDTLVGLQEVKSRVQQLVAVHQVNQVRVANGQAPVSASLHLVFTGDPGTGKTTVARLISRIYRAIGLLSKGHLVEVSRADLVAEYVGQTAPRVRSAVRRASGGVLFIDEAYALASDTGHGFGDEAISTLVREMEEHRADFAVIAAGYQDPMDDFITSNQGLRSRFQTFIAFPDYTPDELITIWGGLAKAHNVLATADVLAQVKKHITSIRTDGETGNARYMRGLFESMFANLAARAAADGQIEPTEIAGFIPDDVPEPNAGALDSGSNPAGFR